MRIFIISILIIFHTVQLSAQQSYEFPAFEARPLKELIQFLEARHDLVFSYRDQNVDTQYITIAAQYQSIENYIHLLFEQTNLQAAFINDRYILLSKRRGAKQNTVSLCGYIKDKNSNQPLPFANILVKNKGLGVTSSEDGRFELPTILPGDTLIISYVGYQKLQVIYTGKKTKDCLTYHLDIQQLDMPPVIVTVYLTDGILQDAHGQKIIIKPSKLSVYPGSVEPDIMTSIQMLPGILSVDETASGIHIRNGTPDQNLVLYDGIPVYHTGHFFGMISAFNPYIVDEVNVYRSGMSSEFGGRVSGVIDIKGDNSIPDKLQVGAGLNMTHGHINAQIPLWKKSGLTLSMRRSFTDFLPTPTFINYAEKVFQGTKFDGDNIPGTNLEADDQFYFSDFNFKWVWSPGKNKFGIDFFSGFNQLNYSTEIPAYMAFSKDKVQLENIGFSMYWSRQWNKNFSSEIKFTNSAFGYFYKISYALLNQPANELISASLNNDINDGGINWVNIWQVKDNHRLKFGYQNTDNELGLQLEELNLDTFTISKQIFRHELHTLFGEYHISLADLVELDLGVRYQRQPLIKNDYFEPRVSLTARISPSTKLKLSTSKQFQFVSQLVIFDLDNLDFANQIWIASDVSDENVMIPVIESNQWTGGLLYAKNDWKIDVEAYVKELAGISSFSNSFNNTGQPFTTGNSRIRGIDLLIKRTFNTHYKSWLSFTLSEAVYEFPALNKNVFPASHDQRRTLKWVHLFDYDPWEFALGWQYGSGLPFTNALGIERQPTPDSTRLIPVINYESQNNSRLPPYHRLDASVNYKFKHKDHFSGFVGLSLINIYNQKNILGRQFFIEEINPDINEPELLMINELGLRFTPNLVVRIQW